MAGPGSLSGWLASMRVAAAAPHLRPPVLDVGCGARAPLSVRFAANEYVGMEVRPAAVAAAGRLHPGYRFVLPDALAGTDRFASVAALAVLEHVTDPAAFIGHLVSFLEPSGTLVLTTPHPIGQGVHTAGARMGLFSLAAVEDHQQLYGYDQLVELLAGAGLTIRQYRRFMLGMNQLVVASRAAA